MIGLVTNVQKGLINVYIEEESKEIKCILRGKLFNQLQKTKSLVVVGDYVEFEKTQGNKGVIKEIKSRKTKLVRICSICFPFFPGQKRGREKRETYGTDSCLKY